MASSTDNYYPDLISFIKNIPNSEITSILKLMQNRAAQDIQSKVLEIDKLVSSMFNAESEMTDDDLIYWYYTMRRLSNKLEKAEEKTLTKLNTLRDGYLCSRCETYVPRNYNTGLLANLQNHNCNAPIAADLPTVKMKEILKEYELFRSIHYDNNIEEQLFYRVLVKEKKEVFYVYTIHVLDKEIFCLVCGCNLPGKPSILQHILGNNHVKTLNKDYDMILTFHQNFLKLEPNYQMLQTEFSIVDIKKVECAVCDQQISFKKLRKHLTGPCFNTPTDEEKNIPVTYEEIVKTTIYKDLLEWCVVIDGINCPILQNIDNKVYCLVCNKYINTHIYTHIDLAEHRDQLSAKNTKQTLKLYHQSWIVQPAHIQIQQIYFRRREQKITCSVCSNFLYYGANHLQQHIESPDHKKFLMRVGKSGRSSTAWETWPALTGSSRSASVETNVDTWTSSSSSERIESTVDNKLPMRTMECRKSSNLEKKASQSGSSGSVSIETDSNNWVTTSSSVSGNGNESATSEIIKQDTTTDSTERAVKEEVPEFQVTIVNEQLKSCQELLNSINLNIAEIIQNHGISNSPRNVVKNEVTETPPVTVANEKLKSLHDMLTSAKAANASINKGNNDAVTEESIEKETDNSITKSVSVDYPQEVFNKLYGGHLIHYYLRVDNVKYPLIQNMDGYNRCLICTIDITGSILFHINSTPHIQLLNDTEKIDQLKKYHNLWMQAREEYQYDQVKFDLGKKLMCKYCLNEVEYELEAVIEHILSTKHVLKKELPIDDSCSGIDEIENLIEVQPTTVLNEDPVAELENKAEFVDTQDCIRKFNGNGLNADESSSSIKKFDPNELMRPEIPIDLYGQTILELVYPNLTQYTIIVNNVPYPCVQFRRNEYYCLLCRDSLKTIMVVEVHINSNRHRARSQQSNCLKILSKFHGVFTKLEPIQQVHQIHFKPYTDRVTCLLCGLVYSYAPELVRVHLESSRHMMLAVNHFELISKPVQEKEIPLKNYKKTVMNSIYENLTDYTVTLKKGQYLYIQRRNNRIYCLICRKSLNDVAEHIKNKKHLDRSKNKSVLTGLKRYHDQFLSFTSELQAEQIYFLPKPNSTDCVLCQCRFTDSSVLKQHLESVRHKKQVNERKSFATVEDIADNASHTSKDTNESLESNSRSVKKEPKQNLYGCEKQQSSTVKKEFELADFKDASYDISSDRFDDSNFMQEPNSVKYYIYSTLIPDFQKKVFGREKEQSSTIERVNKNLCSNWINDSRLEQELNYSYSTTSENLILASNEKLSNVKGNSSKVVDDIQQCNLTMINWINNFRFEQEPNCVKYYIYATMPVPSPYDTMQVNQLDTSYNNSSSVSRIENYKFSQEPNCVKYYIYSTMADDSDVDDSSGNEFADESNLTSRSGKPYCYFCERTVGQDHSSTKQHLKRTDRSSIVFILLHKRVDAFLEKWNRIGEMYREMQRDFIPASHTFTLCLKCGINVNYDDLEDHLERFHNKRYVYHLSEKLSPTFRSPLTRYPDKINRAYFRENIPQCNIIINSTSYPIFQASIEGLCCLLCRAIVDEHVNVHLGSELHLNFLTSSVKRRRIVRYHDIWSLLDMKYQRQMFYFNNVSSFAFKCIPCDEGFAKKKFKIHLENQRHLALLRKDMNSALYNSRTDTPLFLDITSDIQVRSEHDTFKLNMNSVQCSQLDGNYNTDSDSDDAEENSQCYFKSVVDECYPDFDKDFNIVWNGNRYPIFRKTVIGLVCMICKSNPHVPSVEEHLKKQTHFLQAVDKTRQRKLIEFHKVWMEEESSVQMHQKYFHRMKCLPCSVQVNYEAIADHIFNGKHQRKIMLSANLTAIEAAGKDEDGTLKDNQDDNQVASLPSASTTNNSLPIKNQERKEGESSTSTAGNNNNSENAEATPRSIHRKSGHDIKKSVANPDSPNILERLPLRFSILTMFLVVDSNENISCQLCITNVKNDLSSIKEHLKSKNHLAKYVLGTKKMRYFCEICNKQCDAELSWEKHMMESNHISRCNNLGQTRKDRITEYECLTCGLVLYGDDISVRRHNALFGRRKIKELVLPKAVISLFANRDFINANSKKLLEEANKASHSQDKEQQVCVALVRVLKPIFPNCKAYPFGSRVTGLGYCDSDLDVFLDTGDMYHGNYFQEGEKQADIVNLVAKTLKKHKTSFTDLNKVAGARTPIVQVFHKDTGIDCDISFKHGLSVENTAFISLCLDLQPILRPTMLYLKEWSASTNITGLSSYALTMLVIFYMQTVGYLLSVKELRILNPEESEVIADWDTIKYSVSLQTMKEHVEKCEYTVIQLMEKFFEYYANFDFDKCVVSPLLGEAIAKTSFNGYGAGLPLEMAKYVSKLSVRNPEFFRNLSPMCVQDPFDLSHNLTKACSKSIVNKFRGYCNLSMKHLRALE